MKPGEHPTIVLSIAGEQVPLHSHLAYFWESDEEFANGVAFLEAGLRAHDHCVIFGHQEANEAVCRILRLNASIRRQAAVGLESRLQSRVCLDFLIRPIRHLTAYLLHIGIYVGAVKRDTP